MNKYFLIFIILFLLASCSSNIYRKTEKTAKKQLDSLKTIISNKEPQLINNKKTEFISTINYNLRKPNFVIIHHTSQDSVQQTIKTFTLQQTQVSSHYVISKQGVIIQMLSDYLRAWHAGAGSWGKNTDINSASIGIELDNNGKEPFSESQITSLLALLEKLKKDYNIPTQNIIGHSDIAPSRKVDPSIFFPWRKLSENSFGVFPDLVLEMAPVNFNLELALKLIGYDTKILENAVSAFKLHFMQIENNSKLDQQTINTIYNIYKKV